MKKDWIKRLPPGEYTMQDIKDFAGLKWGNYPKKLMVKYGAEIKSVKIEGRNFFKNIFIWKGFPQKLTFENNEEQKSMLIKGDNK